MANRDRGFDISYANTWKRSVKGLPPQVIDRMKSALAEFADDPSKEVWRVHMLRQARSKTIYSTDLFKFQSTLYKAIFRKNGRNAEMLWAGTHESYNGIITSDWLKRQ